MTVPRDRDLTSGNFPRANIVPFEMFGDPLQARSGHPGVLRREFHELFPRYRYLYLSSIRIGVGRIRTAVVNSRASERPPSARPAL
jgi:hypothetical protein